MDVIAFRSGERVTYQRRGLSWIAVSGYRGDRIFYRKSNLAGGGAAWHNVELEYPASDKERMDAIVTHIAHGMTVYNSMCGAPTHRRTARPTSADVDQRSSNDR